MRATGCTAVLHRNGETCMSSGSSLVVIGALIFSITRDVDSLFIFILIFLPLAAVVDSRVDRCWGTVG